MRDLSWRFREVVRSQRFATFSGGALRPLKRLRSSFYYYQAGATLKSLQKDFDDWKRSFKSRASDTDHVLKRVEARLFGDVCDESGAPNSICLCFPRPPFSFFLTLYFFGHGPFRSSIRDRRRTSGRPQGWTAALADGDGDALGLTDGETDGETLGETEGEAEGDGLAEGETDGETEGDALGEGEADGDTLGETDGLTLGLTDGDALGEGEALGLTDGETDGLADGDGDARAVSFIVIPAILLLKPVWLKISAKLRKRSM